MSDESSTAVIEAPTATAPVNPALQSLFNRTWGKGETVDGDQVTTEVAETATEVGSGKEEVESSEAPKPKPPVIQHAELPPSEIFGETPTTKTEPAVADEIPIPKEPPASIKTEKGRADWKAWRAKWEETVAENKQLKTAPKGEQGDPNAAARISELEGRLTQLSSALEETGLERHPAFQQQFIVPKQQMMAKAKEVLGMAEVDGGTFDRTMGLTGKARVQAMDEMMEGITSPTLRTQLAELVFGIDKIDEQIAHVTQDRKGALQRLEQQQRAMQHQQMEAQEKQFNSLLDQSVEYLRDKAGFELLREIPGNEKWNEGRKTRVEAARDLLTRNTDPQQLAGAAVLAVLAPEYRSWAQNERKLRLAAEARIAELEGASPSLGGRTGGESAGEELSGAAAVLGRTWAKK